MARDDEEFRPSWQQVERAARVAADLQAVREQQSELKKELQQTIEALAKTNEKLTTMTISMTELSKDFWYVKGITLGFALVVLLAFANTLVQYMQTAHASGTTP